LSLLKVFPLFQNGFLKLILSLRLLRASRDVEGGFAPENVALELVRSHIVLGLCPA
jgi:hypothetical protein